MHKAHMWSLNTCRVSSDDMCRCVVKSLCGSPGRAGLQDCAEQYPVGTRAQLSKVIGSYQLALDLLQTTNEKDHLNGKSDIHQTTLIRPEDT